MILLTDTALLIAVCVMLVVALTLLLIFVKPKQKKFGNNSIMTDEEVVQSEMDRINTFGGKIAAEERNRNWFERKKAELNNANVGINFMTYIIILTAACTGIFLVMQILFKILPMSIGMGACGILLPNAVVSLLKEKKLNEFESCLEIAIRRMAANMRAGGSIELAIKDVIKSKDIAPSVRKEFSNVLIDLKSGISLEKAFFNLYEKTGSKNVRYMAITTELNRQTGGNMAVILDSIANTITNRTIQEKEVKATLATAKMNVKILSIAPFFLIIALKLMMPAFFEPLTETLIGQTLLVGAMAFILLGAYIMNRKTKIKL